MTVAEQLKTVIFIKDEIILLQGDDAFELFIIF
jgi:hypothetical protein